MIIPAERKANIKRLIYGISDFKQVMHEGKHYVDKTKYLPHIFLYHVILTGNSPREIIGSNTCTDYSKDEETDSAEPAGRQPSGADRRNMCKQFGSMR